MAEKKKKELPQEETLSFEVAALCALLARIMMRCLRERNPRIMEWLSSQSEEHKRTHDAA